MKHNTPSCTNMQEQTCTCFDSAPLTEASSLECSHDQRSDGGTCSAGQMPRAQGALQSHPPGAPHRCSQSRPALPSLEQTLPYPKNLDPAWPDRARPARPQPLPRCGTLSALLPRRRPRQSRRRRRRCPPAAASQSRPPAPAPGHVQRVRREACAPAGPRSRAQGLRDAPGGPGRSGTSGTPPRPPAPCCPWPHMPAAPGCSQTAAPTSGCPAAPCTSSCPP